MSEFAAGDVIEERYRIIRLIGEGGMNRVFLVEDLTTGRQMAMKITRDPDELQSNQPEAYNKFLKEISILTTISHPNLPRVFDYFSLDNRYHIVEEYLEGRTLEERLQDGLPEESEVVRWATALCEVLEVLHKNNIIFRDLKPSNIILTAEGAIKLIDFDIARLYKEGRTIDTTLLGTPGYAAPETYGSAQSDARSDIYSLGATLHHLITGMNPQDRPFLFAPIESVRKECSSPLVSLVEKALQMKPEDRFQCASEVKMALCAINCNQTWSQYPYNSSTVIHPSTNWSKTSDISIDQMCDFYYSLRERILKRAPAGSKTVEKKRVEKYPEITIGQRQGPWSTPAGNVETPWRDTYIWFPRLVTTPSVELNTTALKGSSSLEVTFYFTALYKQSFNNTPWLLELKILPVLPVDVQYTEGCGTYFIIPGTHVSYRIDTPNYWKGSPQLTQVAVIHHDSYIRGRWIWKPDPGLAALKYLQKRLAIGPRILIDVKQSSYAWQYTKGFIIE